MIEHPEEDITRGVDERMQDAEEGSDTDRLKALEEVHETLEAELDEGGEAQPPGR